MSQPNPSEIIPVSNTVNSGGGQQKPNGIIQTQTPITSTSAYIICDNGTVYINGEQIVFSPPQPIPDASKIFSPDLSSQVQCINGGSVEIDGILDMQTSTIQNLGQPVNMNDGVPLSYLQNNYTNATQSAQNIGQAIGDLSGVYVALTLPLDQIEAPTDTLLMNGQAIDGLADPISQQQAVTLNYLQDNYTNATQSAQNIGQAIGDLSSVYVALTLPLDQIEAPTNTLLMNGQAIDDLADPVFLQQAVTLNYLQDNYTDTLQSESYVDGQIQALGAVYMPIDETLNNIANDGPIDVEGFQINNVQPGTLPTDVVVVSQLDGYIPVTGNINSLTAQTADYSTQGFQISNVSAPLSASNLVNRQYVDTQIEGLGSVYQPQSGMADYVQTTFLETYYITSGDIANTYQQISEMVNYVQNQFLTSNYTNNTTLQSTYALISSLSNYVLGSTLTSTLADYTTLAYLQANYLTQSVIEASYATLNDISGFVLESFVTDNYYNKAWIDANFASVSSLSDYVLTSTLNTVLSGYTTSAQLTTILQSYATEAYVQAYTYSRSYIDSNFALISSLASYVTNSSLASQLSSYLQIANIGAYTTSIQTNTSGTKSKVNCATNSEILFNIADVQKLKLYVPAGQSTSPCGLIADDKIQMISGENSFSLTGQKALQAKPTQNYSGLYISGLDNAALNVGQQIQIGSQFCQKLALASGHTDIGGGTQVLYSTISNSAEGVAQQNLQISGGTPQTDNTLILYSDSFASALGTNLSAQFTKKTGYSATTSITEANQFSSKAYVDSAISGLSSVYLTIANAAATYLTISNAASTYQTIANMSNYYTKGQADALFATIASLSSYLTTSAAASTYLTISNAASTYQTIADMSQYYTKTVTDSTFATIQSLSGYLLSSTTLNNIVFPTGSLNMNSQNIINLLDPTTGQMAATKNYVDTQSGSGITLATAKANFIALDGTQTNLITAPIPMNSQKITGLANATIGTDALNRQTADGRYYLGTTTLNSILPPTASLSLNSQKITNLATPTLATDASTKAYVDARAPFKTSIINVGNFRTTTTPVAVAGISGFVTSATKQITPIGAASNYVVINYPDAGYVPLLQVTVGSSTPTPSMQQNPTFSLVFSVSATQATILFGIYDLGGIGLFSAVTWSLNITAMSNTLT